METLYEYSTYIRIIIWLFAHDFLFTPECAFRDLMYVFGTHYYTCPWLLFVAVRTLHGIRSRPFTHGDDNNRGFCTWYIVDCVASHHFTPYTYTYVRTYIPCSCQIPRSDSDLPTRQVFWDTLFFYLFFYFLLCTRMSLLLRYYIVIVGICTYTYIPIHRPYYIVFGSRVVAASILRINPARMCIPITA